MIPHKAIQYRIDRAEEAYQAAKILAEISRLILFTLIKSKPNLY